MERGDIALRARIAGLEAELAVFRAFVGGRELPPAFEAEPDRPPWAEGLNRQQFALLDILVRAEGRVVKKGVILDNLPGYNEDRDEKLVDQLVFHIRKKLGEDVIETDRGVGYRVNVAKLPSAAD